jgi:hypothetical protein
MLTATPASFLLVGLLLLGCRARPVETARAPAADTADPADSGHSTQPVGAAHGKVEFEAPPLIPAMRAQLDQITRPESRRDPSAITSYRGSASRLIEAMEADLVRVGLADSGAFQVLSDSVLNDLGRSTGWANPPDSQRLSANTGRIRRLIALYESWMHQVPS